MTQALTFKFDASKLLAALQKAPLAVSRELRVEMNQGLRVTEQDATAHHRFHNQKGTLEKAIKHEVAPSGLEGRVYIDSGVAAYGAPVHEGSKPHRIYPRDDGNGMFFVKGGTGFFVPKGGTVTTKSYWNDKGTFFIGKGYVNHPGTKPDKFIYEAMARQKPYLLARMSGAVKRAFQMVGFKVN
jgi:hypothetical protein